MEKRIAVGRETKGTKVVKGVEFTVSYGDRVEASCAFDYSGPSGQFTFAFEIGTWFGPLGPFNTHDRWETQNIYLSPGTGKTQKITFNVNAVSGLKQGDVYDLNWEIGKGSQGAGTWQLIERLVTDDVISIASQAEEFKNLAVSFKKV